MPHGHTLLPLLAYTFIQVVDVVVAVVIVVVILIVVVVVVVVIVLVVVVVVVVVIVVISIVVVVVVIPILVVVVVVVVVVIVVVVVVILIVVVVIVIVVVVTVIVDMKLGSCKRLNKRQYPGPRIKDPHSVQLFGGKLLASSHTWLGASSGKHILHLPHPPIEEKENNLNICFFEQGKQQNKEKYMILHTGTLCDVI